MKTTSKCVSLLVALAMMPLHSVAYAQSDDTPSTPVDVIKKYCSLDLGGARLDSKTWSKVAPLITWEDEPGWDAVVVVSGFRVGSPKETGSRTVIPVTFQVVGTLDGDGPFVHGSRLETVSFELARSDSRWKIKQPVMPPHVSVSSISNNIRELIEAVRNNSERKRTLEATLKDLRAAQK
jgi:hypothetical protein